METTTTKTLTFKVELANRIRDGRAVGNLYGVARYINGCRNTWVLSPQDSEDKARAFCASAPAHLPSCVRFSGYAGTADDCTCGMA